MTIPMSRWVLAIATVIYLYFFIPATATLFYELYHLTHIGVVYWGYGGFKAAGYYLGIYEHRLLACLLAGIAVLVIPEIRVRLSGKEKQQ